MSVIHFGTYGFDATEEEMTVTLLNSVTYTGHPIDDRTVMKDDRYGARIDQGERHYDFILNFSNLDSRLENIEKERQIAHQAPYALNYFPTGNGEKCKEFITISEPSIVLSAVKKAEKDNAIVVRLYNSQNKSSSTEICFKWLNLSFEIKFKPYQFKTFILKDGKLLPCNCLENLK